MTTTDANLAGPPRADTPFPSPDTRENSETAALITAANGELPTDMTAYKGKNGVYVRRVFSASIFGYCVGVMLALPILAVTIHAAIMGGGFGFFMGCILLVPFFWYLTTRYSAVVFRPESGSVTFVGFLGLRRRRVKITSAFRVTCEECAIHLDYPGKKGETRRYRLAAADIWTKNLRWIAWETKFLLAAATRDREYARSLAEEELPVPFEESGKVPEAVADDLSQSSLSRPAPDRPLEFPAEPYRSKTLLIEDNRVVFISPFSWGWFLLLTIPYLIVM